MTMATPTLHRDACVRSAVVVSVLICLHNAWTANPPSSPALIPAGNGRVCIALGGEAIISGDCFDLNEGEHRDIVAGTHVDLSTTREQMWQMSRDGWTGSVSAGRLPYGVVWSREIAARGSVAEITFATIIDPIDRGPGVGCSRYKITVPCDLLKGASYTYRRGMHRSGRALRKGKLTGDEPEGKYLLTHVRHIQFIGGQRDFMLDFAPCGVFGLFLEDPSTAYKAHMSRVGDNYVFAIPNRAARFGGKTCQKIVIRAGRHDIDALHPVKMLHYTQPFPVFRRLQFTPDKHAVSGMAVRAGKTGWDQEFMPVALDLFDQARGYGWIDPGKSEMISSDPTSPLGPLFSGGVRGKGKAAFRLQHQNARVLVNLLFSGATGPCRGTVRVNSGAVHRIRVEPGARKTMTIPANVTEGFLDITLTGGNWMLSGIVPQTLMCEHEDYMFSRAWWAFGKAPWQYWRFRNKKLWREWPAAAFRSTRWPL
jgi:hypothetical protein